MSRLVGVLAIVALAGACSKRPAPASDDAAPITGRPIDAAPTSHRPTEPAPRVFAATSAWDSTGTGKGRAAANHDHLVLRTAFPLRQPYGDLLYEGNNAATRGEKDRDGLYAHGGPAVAERWRAIAAQVRGIFVLRDSLFNQQDHPFRHRPLAPMVPPSWITVAVGATQGNLELVMPTLPDATDDDAWAALTEATAFGRFPPSESLLEMVRRRAAGAPPAIAAQIKNAREALAGLHVDAAAMLARRSEGAEAVAREGAERIAATDRRYFGDDLRRSSVIPIFVENPTAHESDEGKGLLVPGHELTTAAAARVARDAFCRRRLRDGDIALERYDLSQRKERRRAIELLEVLIPRGESGATVWLWVTGRLDPRAKLEGDDATATIAAFRQELAAASIETRRLRFVSKPDVVLPKEGRAAAFVTEMARFRELDLPFGANLYGAHYKKLLLELREP